MPEKANSSNKPFFSLVIPALNEEKFLPLLLKDIASQTYQNFEVIIVDGQSVDKTVANAKTFSKDIPNLHILESKVRNVSFQRNMGAAKATGEYIIFNDADNRLPKHFLEGIKYHISVNPIDLFTCWCAPDSHNSYDKTISTYINLLVEFGFLIKQPVAFGAMIGCRKDVFDIVGGFNPKLGFSEDTDFVRQGFKKKLSFVVYHDPRHVFSLRRFRRTGKLKLLQQYAVLNIKYLTNQDVDQTKEYPMGGAHQNDDTTAPDFIKTVLSAIKPKKSTPKIMDRIKALLSLEENKL